MKIGVTGARGFVGSEILKRPDTVEISASLLDAESLDRQIGQSEVDFVIHAASMTSVDDCERYPHKAFEVNVKGTMNVVDSCDTRGIPVIYLSTSHVFSGRKPSPGETDLPNPVNVYGLTKYAAERMAHMSHTSNVVVRSSKLVNGKWIAKNLDALLQGQRIDTPTFLVRSFMHVEHFVDSLMTLCQGYKTYHKIGNGILHVGAPQDFTYYGFWVEVCKQLDIDIDLLDHTRSLETGKLAPRPLRGELNSHVAHNFGISKYYRIQETVQKCIAEYNETHQRN